MEKSVNQKTDRWYLKKKKKNQQEGIKLAVNFDAFVGGVEEDQDAGCGHPWRCHLSIVNTHKIMLSIKNIVV